MFGRKCNMYRNWRAEWKKFNNVPYDLDVVNLGSSGDANNFDYTCWKINGYNLASAPQDMYYDNQILKQYCSHLRHGGRVIICLSEFALLVDKYDADCQNYKYYGFMEHDRIPNYSKIKDFMIKSVPGLLDKRLIKLEVKEFVKYILQWDKHKNNNHSDYLKARAENALRTWKNEFGWTEQINVTQEQQKAIGRSWDILMDDLSICEEHDLIPIILIPPFNGHLKKLLPDSILEECLWKYIRRLDEMGVGVISFWDDEELQKDEYYTTLACFNEIGKKLFNEKVENKLEDIR